jgi:hypothetical protein
LSYCHSDGSDYKISEAVAAPYLKIERGAVIPKYRTFHKDLTDFKYVLTFITLL